MRSQLLLAVALGLGTAFASLESRIYRGTEAKKNEFPFMVSLQADGEHFCGGALLSGNRVLTAAHCSYEFDDQEYENLTITVYGGSYDLLEGGKHIGVKRFIPHPEYDWDTDDNDIAIWELESSFDEKHVKYANLPRPGSDPRAGDRVTSIGWGVTEDDENQHPTKVRKATTPVISRKLCGKAYREFGPITNNMVCSGTILAFRGACFGDSGGPVMLNGAVVGLSSFGRGCVRTQYPSVSTRVSLYLKWIKENM